eukprot:maker-scaffold983_size73474-snap-gene-0.8 protein:Tk00115 transcript:maker-scaffold983_size73474-snap-gene-0.8-mRNA-1 annotation:"PREDICTED: uncharacterized protein LOC100909276"
MFRMARGTLVGQVLFPSNVATRSTRSEAAGVVSPHLPYTADTLVDNEIAMWNKFPALREASTKRMASNYRRRANRFTLYRKQSQMLLLGATLAFILPMAQSECFGGVETYEKTAGTTVVCDSNCGSRGLLTQPDTSVTRDCIAICKQSANCQSFTVDYLNSRCQSYDISTDSRSSRQMLQRDSIVNFFEKICLRGMRQNDFDNMCNSERGWAFERLLDSALDGFDHKMLNGVDSRGECARLCLIEVDFECRSAEFKIDSKSCILSREDRRTQPEAFRKTLGVELIENQCVKELPDCSYSTSKQDVTVVSMDDILFSRTVNDCQRFCDDARAFQCRSFAQLEDRCYLSGDDSISLDSTPQPIEIGAIYKEKLCTRSTCDGGIFTYEKTTGHFLRTAIQEPLSNERVAPGITYNCSTLCSEVGSDCPAFAVDYSGQRCFKLDRNTQGRGDSLAPQDGTSYFEKICLRGDISQCQDKAWAFERVPDKMIQGYDEKDFENIPSRRDCEELCLKEQTFECQSAEYDTVALTCSLSKESRRSKPNAFREARNIDYLENACLKTSDLDCLYQQTSDAYPRYLDDVINDVKDEVACEVQCTFFEKFLCRSFAFYSSAQQCFISGDDRASAFEGALQNRPGTHYFERNCNQRQSSTDSETSPTNRVQNEITFLAKADHDQNPARCSFGHLTFEKTTGYELIRALPTKLHSDRDGGIIEECAKKCKEDAQCLAFNMDFNRNECQSLAKNSDTNLFNVRASSGSSFFEAICLNDRGCGMLWTFERVLDMELQGHERSIKTNLSKTECEDACLLETSYPCKSANYNHLSRNCVLNEADRISEPKSLLPSQGIDYLENQCKTALTANQCDYSLPIQDQYLVYTDKVIDAFSPSSCQQACSQERNINCRSFSFLSESRPGTPQCYLSGDTQETAGRNAFQLQNGATYSERKCGSTTLQRPQTKLQAADNSNNVREVNPDNRSPEGLDRELDSDPDNTPQMPEGDPRNCETLGMETSFEKIVDYNYERGRKTQIDTAKDIGIVIQCLDHCKDVGEECLSVTLLNERGGRQRCFKHESSALIDQTDPSAQIGVTYFEKICVPSSNRKFFFFIGKKCRKDWAFVRVPQFEYIGESIEELGGVNSVEDCRNLCTETTLFQCRAATFYANSKICKLSEQTRRSAPSDFRPADRGTYYLENECADLQSNCEYVDQPGTYLPFTDTYLPSIADIEECRSQCSAQGQYNCRSFNYNAFRKECFLSADDSNSIPTGLQNDRDFTFSERAGCNTVQVECTPSDMLVRLSLARDFNGRIYATGNPQACFELGNGQSDMTLRIPLGSECGTVQQNRGRYVNHVVIQENPVIMQETDKTVRVECAFTADDQTVSFKPTAGMDGRQDSGGGISVTVPFQPTGTNIVTNTAPTPGVRMRVVRRNGETANMVGLGEDLQLRIEIDQESAFGLFARRLEARTDNGELMNLIDESGCPVNELIFPSLQLEPSTRALFTDFKAFRFPSTPIVNFVATVQFCQEVCEPMECPGNLNSYGRRRRALPSNKEWRLKHKREADGQSKFTQKLVHQKDKIRIERSTKDISDERDGDDLNPNILPEHVDLGLRLTVGEEVNQKPFLPSSQGDGHFPMANNRAAPTSSYYPRRNGRGDSYEDPSLICSPPSSLIAVLVIVLVLNVAMIAAFIIFYRQKKKFWSKRVGALSHFPHPQQRPVTSPL